MAETREDFPWHEYIDRKVRLTYLAVLGYISEKGLPAVVVGSAALLARGYYQKNYWWDIDLLFPHVDSLKEFNAGLADAPDFLIEHVEEELQSTPELFSLHTLWSYKKGGKRAGGWVNVDLIVRRDFDWHTFHRRVIERYGKFTQRVERDDEVFSLNLFMAHPWGIFVEKIFSPRVMKEMVTEDNYSYDARDIFTLLERDGTDPEFVSYLSEVLAREWVDPTEFRKRFMLIVRRKGRLGYGYVHIPSGVLNCLR